MKETRGGARPGAGRKTRITEQTKQIRVKERSFLFINEKAAALGCTQSEVVEELIKHYIDR